MDEQHSPTKNRFRYLLYLHTSFGSIIFIQRNVKYYFNEKSISVEKFQRYSH